VIEVLDIPKVNLTLTNSNCNENNGGATASITDPGSVTSKYLSSGSNTLTILDLEPNAYYFNVVDTNGCYVIDFATITSIELTLSGSVTDLNFFWRHRWFN
jgi:hypothetical protein